MILYLYKERNDKKLAVLDPYLDLIEKSSSGLNVDTHALLDTLEYEIVDGMSDSDIIKSISQVSSEKMSIDDLDWQYFSSRVLSHSLKNKIKAQRGEKSFYEVVSGLVKDGIYSPKLLKKYTEKELNTAYLFIDESRDNSIPYAGYEILMDRYLTKSKSGVIVETVQERFLVIALFLFINEKKNRLDYVKNYYDKMSNQKFTTATPTTANAGKLHHQLSSCFIDSIEDSIDGIFSSFHDLAKISKMGGGIGVNLSNLRSSGSFIRGVSNKAKGVIPWAKGLDNIATSVDQLGVRSGAISPTLAVYHKDILDFIKVRMNNIADKMRAPNIFPAISVPDLFMQTVELGGDWYLFDPYEIRQKGYNFEQLFGEEFNKAYLDCVGDENISRTVVKAQELMESILTAVSETSSLFFFFKDRAAEFNPNSHIGNPESSNLCTEVLQNMSPSEYIEEYSEDGDIVRIRKAGDFVTCNLASINLADVKNYEELENTISLVIRGLDNVIDLTQSPVEQSKLSNSKYRPIGLGSSGLYNYFINRGIEWDSWEHIRAEDELYENFAYFAIKASMELAKERGAYPAFEGSDWHTGAYFEKRGYTSERWLKLAKDVREHGIRNGYLMAIAPTASTSIISNSTPCIEPPQSITGFFDKKDINLKYIVPGYTEDNKHLFKTAFEYDPIWAIRAASMRQRHIDQSQSFNMFLPHSSKSYQSLLELYMLVWKSGLKTTYYTFFEKENLDDINKEEISFKFEFDVDKPELDMDDIGMCFSCSS